MPNLTKTILWIGFFFPIISSNYCHAWILRIFYLITLSSAPHHRCQGMKGTWISIIFIKESWNTRTDEGWLLWDRRSFADEIFMMTCCLAMVTRSACICKSETQGGISPGDATKRKTSLMNTASASLMKFLLGLGKENVYWRNGQVG